MNEENIPKHGECLEDETLADYLGGTLDPVVHTVCEVHLAACDACRRNLAALMHLLRTATAPEEEAVLQTIVGKSDHRHLRAFPVQKPIRGIRRTWVVALSGIAAVVLIAVPSWIMLHRDGDIQRPSEILYKLLLQNRPFEAQLADEPHRDRTRSRVSGSDVDFVALTQEMTQLSADQYEMGKFYLIQEDFDRAIPNLESAEKDPGATAAVHNDLGVAYLERRGTENRVRAGKEFRHALDRNPNFLPAIFNLSLLYDMDGKPVEADGERRRYLQLDSKSGWANEIRSKLDPAGR